MYLEFHGAADEVTGSLHRLHVAENDIALDCGLFQGHRADANRRNREVPAWATAAQALVLSHAHLDHSGNIPSLVKRGFRGNVYCTPSTRDLAAVMLRDAAMIQEQDARYLNQRAQREGSEERITPLYGLDDAQAAVEQMVSIGLHRPLPITPQVTLTFHNAGHVLGSSLVALDLQERGKRLRLLFSGDLGRAELPLLQSPEIVKDVDVLMLESTYGDRHHPDFANTDDELGVIIRDTIGRSGRVYIPCFALERAQEVLFALERLHEKGALPEVPIYIDSPLAIRITEIYKLHPEGLSDPVRQRLLGRNDPFSPPGLEYVSEVAASKALQRSGDPCIIIAGSGMCEGGRIVHHLRDALEKPANSVVIVGFMAQHTLGRRLVEGRPEVKVLGIPRHVHARVHQLVGLSAHADQGGLVRFAQATARAGNVRKILLVHGEPSAQRGLKTELEAVGLGPVTLASPGDRLDL
jgi:metallo-beta-lactamase family protein